MDRKRLVDQLIVHEGCKLHAYQDSEGWWTIGIGRLIDARKGGGISMEEAIYLLGNDIDKALREAEKHPWFASLDPVRQNCIVELIFNLGPTRFRQFRRMLAALSTGNYAKAAAELVDSRWSEQVGPIRSRRLMEMLRDGRWPK